MPSNKSGIKRFIIGVADAELVGDFSDEGIVIFLKTLFERDPILDKQQTNPNQIPVNLFCQAQYTAPDKQDQALKKRQLIL